MQESLGGARLHTAVSGVAHYMAKDDADCLEMIRAAIPRNCPRRRRALARHAAGASPPKVSTTCCPPIIGCPTTSKK